MTVPAWMPWAGHAALAWVRLRWELRRPPMQAGVLVLLLLALLAGALALKNQRERLVRLQSVPAAARSVLPSQTIPALQRLAVFEQGLPTQQQVPQLLQDLLQQGQQTGLDIARGEYRWQFDGAGGLAAYHMRLPARGQAAQLLRFMRQALAQYPTLALEGLSMNAIDGAGQVEARLDWVLVVRGSAGWTH